MKTEIQHLIEYVKQNWSAFRPFGRFDSCPSITDGRLIITRDYVFFKKNIMIKYYFSHREKEAIALLFRDKFPQELTPGEQLLGRIGKLPLVEKIAYTGDMSGKAFNKAISGMQAAGKEAEKAVDDLNSSLEAAKKSAHPTDTAGEKSSAKECSNPHPPDYARAYERANAFCKDALYAAKVKSEAENLLNKCAKAPQKAEKNKCPSVPTGYITCWFLIG